MRSKHVYNHLMGAKKKNLFLLLIPKWLFNSHPYSNYRNFRTRCIITYLQWQRPQLEFDATFSRPFIAVACVEHVLCYKCLALCLLCASLHGPLIFPWVLVLWKPHRPPVLFHSLLLVPVYDHQTFLSLALLHASFEWLPCCCCCLFSFACFSTLINIHLSFYWLAYRFKFLSSFLFS